MPIQDIYMIDALWLTIAFLSGLAVKRMGLPALIGFLLTGLVLNALNIKQGNIYEVLSVLSDLGIMLLLFTIGLKIKIKSLLKQEVWFTASAHMLISVLAIASLIFLISFSSIRLFTELNVFNAMLIGFALSFSSTVFAAKLLEERGELSSFHGKIAIGVLIIQDLFAVVFLAISSNETPSLFALLIPLYLYIIRFALFRILHLSGHGELLTAFGFFAAFVSGALVFKMVGIKPDLGALFMGMLLVNHPKADELYDRMMNYKDFFLIAFFVSIGLTGMPGWETILPMLILLPFMFLKGGLFMMLLSGFNLRARTAFLAAVSLGNFSEFGLIVSLAGYKMGWISGDWMMVIALLMSVSFLIASPLNAKVHTIFDRYKYWILKLNRGRKNIDTEPTSLGDAEYVIIGMGSIGKPAYKYFEALYPGKVMGVDYKHENVEQLKNSGCHVTWGDAVNPVFWRYANFSKVKMVMLAMSDFSANYNALNQIQKLKRKKFKVAAVIHYADEAEAFRKKNIDYIYDYKASIGADFAEHALSNLLTKPAGAA